jgi:hypothetical protein
MGKTLPFSCTAVIVSLLWAVDARATAIYDVVTHAHLAFSHSWQSYTTTIVPATSGTGAHQEITSRSESIDAGNRGYFQSVQVTGSAGNSAFTSSGMSYAEIDLYTYFTFDFGSVPTNFVMTFIDYGFVTNQSTALPWNPSNNSGERVSGGFQGVQLLFDGFGGGWYTIGQPNVIQNVSGLHTVRLWTGSGAIAEANYPYLAPEPSSIFLLTVGLPLALSCVFRLLSRDKSANQKVAQLGGEHAQSVSSCSGITTERPRPISILDVAGRPDSMSAEFR